jgi:carbamoyl-phosphate synthase large subunit
MTAPDLPRKVIILGSGALKIGEAGEFDYSGAQAIKAVKSEGIEAVLVNPNIATIQTGEHLADRVYFLPVNPEWVERVIEREKPDAIMLSFGGQTALNCGLALHSSGVLQRHGVRVLGTPIESIVDTEDRDLFARRLAEIGVPTPRSRSATTVEEAMAIGEELGYPVMGRVAYALGGLGSGVCRTPAELEDKARRALVHAPQILVEEYLEGWKEIEYEVVRDGNDNCVTVCNMENLDPLGIHTGESIVVAPSQTLTDREYHRLREAAIRTIRHLGIVGECNIQYALNPRNEEFRVIEVNARLSRSSALASKATGYPLAYVAAKIALGLGMDEIANAVTRSTKAFFEPALDYCVVKVPRWDLKKFRNVSRRIGSSMKSVGEVMAIGRTFEEALQKALRMIEVGAVGLVGNTRFRSADVERELREPTEERIFAVVQALEQGMTVDQIHALTHIDRWFLHKIRNTVETAALLRTHEGQALPAETMRRAKRQGFSDAQIATFTKRPEAAVTADRHIAGVRPALRQIDTLAAEYPAQTNYLYLTYDGGQDEIAPLARRSVLILGSGCYRIGSSVEFDWCAVNTSMTLRQRGVASIMLNCNPETVSTDYDESDVLVFDELSVETVRELCDKLKPMGVVVSMGGQSPNNLALALDKAGVKLLGTRAESIDRAENRRTFSDLLDRLGIDQPEWARLTSSAEAEAFASRVGYPVLVRPSYVLSGSAMAVASNAEELNRFLQAAAAISPEHPVVISKFIEDAKEIEFDGVAQDGRVVIYAISEHVENAGVHSGDATLVLPPQRIYLETIRRIRETSARIAESLDINGPFNIQFIARGNALKVIECNLRASRSFPFVSKVLRRNFIEAAARIILGERVETIDNPVFELPYVAVKAPHFSFLRLEGADPSLGVEMASTGEIACFGDTFEEAFIKALQSIGYRFPVRRVLISSGNIKSKAELLESVRDMAALGVSFFATPGTAAFLIENGIAATPLYWPDDSRKPNTIDYIRQRQVDLVINIPKNNDPGELSNDYAIRRSAVDFGVPLITNRQIVRRLAEALTRQPLNALAAKPWNEYRPG